MATEYKSELVPIRFSIWSGTPKAGSDELVTKVLNRESKSGWQLHSQAYVSPPNWSSAYTGNLNLVFQREI